MGDSLERAENILKLIGRVEKTQDFLKKFEEVQKSLDEFDETMEMVEKYLEDKEKRIPPLPPPLYTLSGQFVRYEIPRRLPDYV